MSTISELHSRIDVIELELATQQAKNRYLETENERLKAEIERLETTISEQMGH